MLRFTVLILTVVIGAAVLLTQRTDKPLRAIERPELRTAPALPQTAQKEPEKGEGADTSANSSSDEDPCPKKENAEEPKEIWIGSFERPDEVPEYKILDEKLVERDDVKAAQLLVDTQERSKAGYTLIARDIKAQYEDLDAVTAQFTDATVSF